MRIQTSGISDRKALARQISERLLDAPVAYAGAPTFAYKVGDVVIIDRDGNIEITNDETQKILEPSLVAWGWLEAAPKMIPEPPQLADGETMESNASDKVDRMEISVPAEDMTVTELKNLTYLLYSKQYLINRATGKETLRIPELLVNRLKEYTIEEPEAFTELLNDCRALGELDGFDFKDGKVTLSFPFDMEQPGKGTVYAELTHRIVKAAREATRVTPTLTRPENEKYAMRSWLLRLGYGGADFKAQRHTLLQNLKGYAAFKTDDEMVKHRAKYADIRRAKRETRKEVES